MIVNLITQLVVAAEGETSAERTFGVWEVVVAVGVIVGLAAGLHQLGTSVRRRRFREAEEFVLATARNHLQVESAKDDVEKYTALTDALRNQVETEVPREARRVYLRSRLEALEQQIGVDVDQYNSLDEELFGLEQRAAKPIDRRLRTAIAVPRDRRPSRRRDLSKGPLLLACVVLGLLALSPVDPIEFIRDSIDVISDPDNAYASDVAVLVVVWTPLWGLAAGSVARWWSGSLDRPLFGSSRRIAALGLATLLAVATLAVGVAERDRAEHLLAQPLTDKEYERQDAIDTRSAVLIGIGIPATGIVLGLGSLALVEARRRRVGY